MRTKVQELNAPIGQLVEVGYVKEIQHGSYKEEG